LGYPDAVMLGPLFRCGIGAASHRLRQGRRKTTPSSLKTQRIGSLTDAVSGLDPDHPSMDWHLLDTDIEAA
jgi:hypothetical protein